MVNWGRWRKVLWRKGIGGENSSDESVAVVKGSGGEKGLVAKGSGGEKVGGEWVSDEKVSGE